MLNLTGLLTLTVLLFLQLPTFDVVSVKPSSPTTRGMSVQTSQGRFVARGATLQFLLQYAYRLKPAQIIGGPNWLTTDKFDVEGRTDAAANKDSDDALVLMLRSTLEERFKLKSHRETREIPIFVLTVAKGGPKLKPAEDIVQNQSRQGRSATMANLAAQLSQNLDRLVVDQTGLTGSYDFQLEWRAVLQTFDDSKSSGTAAAPGAPPSLFTALQEQLGLKLESSRTPVEVLVIDRLDKPSEN